MKRVLKILGIILGVLVVVIVVLAIIIFFLSNSQLNKKVEVQAESIEIPEPTDEVLARGEYLTHYVGVCIECHGPTLAGDNMIDVPIFAVVNAPNLTPGQGGTGNFTDEDFVRAIRHGVGPDGKRLLIMPSSDFANFSEEDLGAVIAYLKSLPPQDHVVDGNSYIIGRALMVMSPSDFFEYENIDHTAPFPPAVEEGVTAEYGGYLASIACAGCHGTNYSGRSFPGGGETSANLTPAGPLADYTFDDFLKVFHEGVALDGREIDTDNMPWATFGSMTDDDLEAIFTFLQTLPPQEDKQEAS